MAENLLSKLDELLKDVDEIILKNITIEAEDMELEI